MNLDLIRRWLTGASTIGELYVDGERECFILEDKYRAPPEKKVPGATCIPCGVYHVEITHSPKFGTDLPLIWNHLTDDGRKIIRFVDDFGNVTQFEGVRFHAGNYPSDTEGCLLPGRDRLPDAVQGSRLAFVDLFAKLQGSSEPITLTISLAVEGGICL